MPNRRRPRRLNLTDLSALDDKLTANLMLGLTIGRGFPPGKDQHRVTAFIRTFEVALRCYERARLQLELSVTQDSLTKFIRGLDDMELTFITLHRGMRLAEALMDSPGTKVRKQQLPRFPEREELRKMRNAIDHREGAIRDGLAGAGHTLALEVRENDLMIDDYDASCTITSHTITHAALGDWVRTLHELAVDLTNHPDRYVRP
jgi:hypothetical protein